jgi:hypothetical protein
MFLEPKTHQNNNTEHSSAGRAFDCRGNIAIKGSLVQIRVFGLTFSYKLFTSLLNMNLIKSLKNRLEQSVYQNIADSDLFNLSKTTLFRSLPYKDKQAVEVFDFRDITDQKPNNSVLITCEHATNKLHKYMLKNKEQSIGFSHWAYDPGAKDIAIGLSEKARVLSIYTNYSRLIIDPNRSLLSDTLIRRFVEKNIELEMNKKGNL